MVTTNTANCTCVSGLRLSLLVESPPLYSPFVLLLYLLSVLIVRLVVKVNPVACTKRVLRRLP